MSQITKGKIAVSGKGQKTFKMRFRVAEVDCKFVKRHHHHHHCPPTCDPDKDDTCSIAFKDHVVTVSWKVHRPREIEWFAKRLWS